MTEPNASDTAEAAGGEGWAKTVVDGVAGRDTAGRDTAGRDTAGRDAAGRDTAGGESGPPAPPVDPTIAADEATASEAGPDGGADDEVIEAELVDDPDQDTGAEADPGPGGDDADGPPAGTAADGTPISIEDLVADLERVSAERDRYLDASRRLQAEFENYKKQIMKRESEARERANDSLIGELLPVLDAFDGAVANGAEDVAPIRGTILDALNKQGLERIDPTDDTFDPNLHEAVMHEPGDEADGPVVAEVMRAGYVWKGRVLRPAMVKTRG